MSSMRPLVFTGPIDRHFTNEYGDADSCAAAEEVTMRAASMNAERWAERRILCDTDGSNGQTKATTYGAIVACAIQALVQALAVIVAPECTLPKPADAALHPVP